MDDGDTEADEKHQIYIADIKRNDEHKTVTLLINRGDPNAVSPAFIDSSNSEVRIVQQSATEAPGWYAPPRDIYGCDRMIVSCML